ncbi:DUF1330 domain-containing protein [Mycolicibacterium vaccae]|uniref:DUF1330 domain-containing protein n=1 Tax=Mycolicibacterium vaccae ATCC 25954 TaxID=1194972 RepID=K0V8F0_MYCVA|nr:DUF1330 domain-containing protein [Mycolicibacterium vaccae]ANI41299.1 hypothetical protein MYVA_4201 [Mycolicibacterium vaccae 95051]EJZ11138.1 hypothetical protein MVAC_06757 [Mycolicibacterium vaccae ATCC 25954]MCV7063524.1 DUF1330 domain-containing protein [Mycolicibacterium vaccae]
MSGVYVLFQLVIDDIDAYREYEAVDHRGMLEKFNGKFVGADAAAEVLEGQWPYRTALVEFPTRELAHAWFESPEYRAAAELRHRSATSNVVIISGV